MQGNENKQPVYSLGFIFDSSTQNVLLIQKQKPEWQKGKLNGIGGKCESGEKSIDCMIRETKEETGLETSAKAWTYIGAMKQSFGDVDVFTLKYEGSPSDAQHADHEEIAWLEAEQLPNNVMQNLRWLIPLAQDKLRNNEFENFSVHYKENST